MSPVKVLIVEDESLIALGLKVTLEAMGYEVPAMLSCGNDAAADFDVYKPDLIFMDIHLANKTNGIEAAKKINATRSVPIVFITQNQDEQVLNKAIFEGHAAYYLQKPFSKSQVSIAMAMGLKYAHALHAGLTAPGAANGTMPDQDLTTSSHLPSTSRNEGAENYVLNDCIFIKENHRFVKVAVNDILYLEADGSYCIIHTKDRKFTLSNNLYHFEKKLAFCDRLRRCNRSYVVNIDHITEITETSVRLQGADITIGETYAKEFRNLFRFIR
jgi:DNA-binding LytR/AlgR family response regulator